MRAIERLCWRVWVCAMCAMYICKLKPTHHTCTQGVRYENYYPNASVDSRFVPWQSSFKTEDKAEVAHLLKEGNFEFEWTASGGLRKWNVLSPFKDHPVTGEKMWVNMIVANHASYFHDHPSFPELANIPYTDPEPISAAIPTATAPSTPAFAPQQHQQQQQHVPEGFEYPFNIKYGDGSNVPYSVIQTLRGLAWERAKAPSAENGDLLIVDNYRVQHGRLGYEAPRKELIAMCNKHNIVVNSYSPLGIPDWKLYVTNSVSLPFLGSTPGH